MAAIPLDSGRPETIRMQGKIYRINRPLFVPRSCLALVLGNTYMSDLPSQWKLTIEVFRQRLEGWPII